jgi:hypothetical protein
LTTSSIDNGSRDLSQSLFATLQNASVVRQTFRISFAVERLLVNSVDQGSVALAFSFGSVLFRVTECVDDGAFAFCIQTVGPVLLAFLVSRTAVVGYVKLLYAI